MSLLYFKCPNCGNEIKKISKFKDLFVKKNLVCENCNSDFKPSWFFTFLVDSFTTLSIIIVVIFAYFANEVIFPNSDKMYLVSHIIGTVLYLIASAF